MNNSNITGTSAHIATDSSSDFGFAGARIKLKQSQGGHEHARRAEAALDRVMINECLL